VTAKREPKSPRRLSFHNASAALRLVKLRATHRNIGGVFYLGPRAVVRVGPDAKVTVGSGTTIHEDFTGAFIGTVEIGRDVFINRGGYIAAHEAVHIGDGCLFGEYVTLHDDDHVFGPSDEKDWESLPPGKRGLATGPITIGRNVWLGAKVTITKNVTIGEGSVVAANSVVTRDLPAFCLAAGSPARVIRTWGRQVADAD
jgi:acetyltransferase-like isoleucine patch superfamily enzyme